LSEHFRVIAPDHRGHGRTPPGDEAVSLSACATDALAVADALGVEHFIAVGYSMGGPIAQLMWRQQPRRIDGLVLAATSRDFRGRARDRLAFQAIPLLLAATRVRGSRALREMMFSLLAPRVQPSLRAWAGGELRRADPCSVLEAAADLGRFSSRAWVHEIDVPTSVIVAMNDQVVPVRRQLKLARAIDRSVAAFVDGDHYAVDGAPEDFLRVLLHECLAIARRSRDQPNTLPSYWEMSS
jgi:3-oxoadipate enol-lactonase